MRVNKRKFFRGLLELSIRALPARVLAAFYLLRALFSSDFQRALEVVQSVARDPSTRNLDTWTAAHRVAVSNPKWGENMYRALSARVKFRNASPEAALLLELAYLAYKRGKHV